MDTKPLLLKLLLASLLLSLLLVALLILPWRFSLFIVTSALIVTVDDNRSVGKY